MKANGGIFVIDDFGRQRLHPRELLNRWMVPLDRGVDFLTFTSGRRATIPFSPLVVFATNMDPFDLVEEAFLRRIRFKIEIKSPNKEEFTEIFRRLCGRYGIEFDRGAVDFIYRDYYIKHGIAPRGCHPRDLIADLIDLAPS
jgi:SpoVK/Ycf46/Vps4 family AAA+-type ATPase